MPRLATEQVSPSTAGNDGIQSLDWHAQLLQDQACCNFLLHFSICCLLVFLFDLLGGAASHTHTSRQTYRDRQACIQVHVNSLRQTEAHKFQPNTQTNTATQRHTGTHRCTSSNRQQTGRQAGRQAGRQTDRQTDRQTHQGHKEPHTHTDKHTNKHTDKHTDKHT